MKIRAGASLKFNLRRSSHGEDEARSALDGVLRALALAFVVLMVASDASALRPVRRRCTATNRDVVAPPQAGSGKGFEIGGWNSAEGFCSGGALEVYSSAPAAAMAARLVAGRAARHLRRRDRLRADLN
ncbi:MAG: hypothetical protein U0002_07170 [Thermoanaerobaculia bacterium]